MILKPGSEDIARAVFDRWELDFAKIGVLTDSGRIVLRHHGETVCDLPLGPLVDEAPLYDRPHVPTPKRAAFDAASVPAPNGLRDALLRLIGSPNLASKRWIWEQYDHLVTGQTVQRPGGDAAVVRIEGAQKGLALTTDCTPRYCFADPERGGAHAVVETYRNLTAVGATPLAVTNNLNFGNPERPEIMGQLVGCIVGIGTACRALDYPVVSGNVSLYNETNGKGILPTPVIGGVGVLANVAQSVSIGFKQAGAAIIALGGGTPSLGCSLYLRALHDRDEGGVPALDLPAEKRCGELVRRLIGDGTVQSCHDVSDGGLLVAVAEMTLAGGTGAAITLPGSLSPVVEAFGEGGFAYLLAVPPAAVDAVVAAANAAQLSVAVIGVSGGDALTVNGGDATSVSELLAAHDGWLPGFMTAS